MADNGKDKREDEITVVKDESDEVIRLDAPEPKPIEKIEKKGKIAAETIVTHSKEEDEKVEKEILFDPENEWHEGMEEKGSKTVPMGWFVLLGLGLVGVVVWAALQSLTRDRGDDVETVNPVGLFTGKPLGKLAEIEAQRAAEKHFMDMEAVVSGFLAADTIEGKAKYVRHRDRVLPLMKQFYKDHPLVVAEFSSTKEYRITSLEYRPFLALDAEAVDGENYPILLEDTKEGILVDWESFVCFQPIPPETYVKEKPLDPVSMRVYVTPDHFYAYEFADESEYSCYKLSFRKSEQWLYGFVKRGGVLDQKFRVTFPESKKKAYQPLILKLRFPEGSRTTRCVFIEDLESKLWAFAENPAEVASSEKGE